MDKRVISYAKRSIKQRKSSQILISILLCSAPGAFLCRFGGLLLGLLIGLGRFLAFGCSCLTISVSLGDLFCLLFTILLASRLAPPTLRRFLLLFLSFILILCNRLTFPAF